MNGRIIEDHGSLGMETSTSVRTHPIGEDSLHRQPQHIEGRQGFAKSCGDQEVRNTCCSPVSQFDVHALHNERHHLPSNHQDEMVTTRRDLNNRRHHRRPLRLRQQRISSLVATAAALLLFSPSIITYAASSPYRASSALFVPPRSRTTTLAHSNHFMSTQKRPKQNRPIDTVSGSWSNAVRQKSELDESRFGVRNRVKSVLKKAKKRTGIENASADKGSPSKRSGASIIAETASIGAWDVDVAIDMVSKVQEQKSNDVKNGKVQQQLPDEMTPSEPKYEDAAILSKLANEITGSTKNGVKVNSASSTANVETKTSSDDDSPEDDFVISSSSSTTSAESEKKRNSVKRRVTEKDAFTGDVSAAFSLPREPLPFELPSLDTEQYRRLMDGERVQYQDDMGRAGSGFVVWDVKAPSSVVWDCLLDFQSYPQTIPTVREVVMYTNTHLKEDYRAEKPIDFEDGTAAICKHGVPSVTRAQFALSKFKLKIAAVHKYRPHPKGDYMIFTLDPASSNMALKYAKGIWYTESNPDGKEGHTRVWLLCELRVSRLLPQWIVDYAASRAMPRATTWLKPQVEAAAQLWLRDR